MRPLLDRTRVLCTATLAIVGALFVASCDQNLDQSTSSQVAPPRIASFSPALTSMLLDLDLEEHIVGRSTFCTIESNVPVVGDLLDVHYEQLVRLQPTHILLQCDPSQVDPGLRRISEERNWSLVAYRLDGVDDIRNAMESLPEVLLDEHEQREATRRIVADCLDRLDASLTPPIPGLSSRRVLVLSPFEPPLAWGRGTWMSQLLERLGASNALESSGWVSLSWEELLRTDMDHVVIVSTEQPATDSMLKTMLARHGQCRIDVVVNPDINVPTTRIADIAAALRQVLASEQGGGR